MVCRDERVKVPVSVLYCFFKQQSVDELRIERGIALHSFGAEYEKGLLNKEVRFLGTANATPLSNDLEGKAMLVKNHLRCYILTNPTFSCKFDQHQMKIK